MNRCLFCKPKTEKENLNLKGKPEDFHTKQFPKHDAAEKVSKSQSIIQYCDKAKTGSGFGICIILTGTTREKSTYASYVTLILEIILIHK